MEDLKAKFVKVYANVPLKMRQEVAVVVNNEPLSWNAAYLEVKNSSKPAPKILKELKDLELI